MRRITALLGAVIALTIAAASCGVPGSGDFQRINPDNVPAVLNETTSTTAPSTTRPAFTAPPPTATAPTTSTSTTLAPTSSTTAVYDVQLYFVAGPGQLTAITRQLASPAPGQVLSALVDGVPDGTEYEGLSTTLPPPGLEWNVSVTGGRATVEVPPEFLTETPARDQPLAIAQIVLSLTSRPGIGQVTFVSDEQPIAVIKGDGQQTTVGADVVCEDYSDLAANAACG